MRKNFLTIILICCLQQTTTAQSSAIFDTAYRVARKIQESLSLDSSVMINLFHINMQVQLKKVGLVAGSMQVQAVEQFRDTAYRRLMTYNQFQTYLQRRQLLLTY